MTSVLNTRKFVIASQFKVEVTVKRVVAISALALFGLAPAVGSACEYNNAMASATPQAQLGLAQAPAPAATKAPAVAKAPVAKAVKQVASTDKAPARDVKVAVVTAN